MRGKIKPNKSIKNVLGLVKGSISYFKDILLVFKSLIKIFNLTTQSSLVCLRDSRGRNLH